MLGKHARAGRPGLEQTGPVGCAECRCPSPGGDKAAAARASLTARRQAAIWTTRNDYYRLVALAIPRKHWPEIPPKRAKGLYNTILHMRTQLHMQIELSKIYAS